MKLGKPRTVSVTKWIKIPVEYKRKKFEISVRVTNGKIQGENHKNGLATSYLTYFNETPEHIRQRHFLQIKKLVESKTK